jgi:hypothetical protein
VSVKVQSLAWERAQLPPSEKLVLLALADHAHDDGTSAKPGVAYLAWKTDLSERTVQRSLKYLEDVGLIAPTAHEKGGRGCCTEYTLYLANLPLKPAFQPNSEAPKGDTVTPISTLNGDRLTPITEPKRVTPVTERVTNGSLKGDTGGKSDVPPKEVVLLNQEQEPSEPRTKTYARGQANAQPSVDADFKRFWETYPARHGKRLRRDKAVAAWNAMPEAKRQLALRGAVHYRTECDSGTLAKDAFRWLRDSEWVDWQEAPVIVPAASNGNGHHPQAPTNRENLLAAMREDGVIP